MNDDESRRALRDLLKDVPDEEVHEMCSEALRRWRDKRGTISWPDPISTQDFETFSMHGDLGPQFLPLLAARKQTTLTADQIQVMKERLGDGLHNEWLIGVAEWVWWIIRAGLAVETGRTEKRAYPQKLRLTNRGVRWLSATKGEDHPLLPGFLDRIKQRCPNLPAAAIELLVDARACLDHTLYRPAVVLIGVAYELIIGAVIDELINKNLTGKGAAKETIVDQIARMRALIPTPDVKKLIGGSDDVRAATAAYDFAEALRQRRNDAAHAIPAMDFVHRAETEEYFVSACRHIPGLCSPGL